MGVSYDKIAVVVHEAIGVAKSMIFIIDPAEDVKKGYAVLSSSNLDDDC